ncbi:MAG: hypothetical protein Q4G49_04780 [Paracoccus sp. (in: a-proteobacteria)]|nr:hypothetical protein [Paracoccus sp. (in: a-proteobacteria)]
MRAAFAAGVRFTAVYVIVVSVLLFVLRDVIAGLFDAQGETLALIHLFCGPPALLSFSTG